MSAIDGPIGDDTREWSLDGGVTEHGIGVRQVRLRHAQFGGGSHLDPLVLCGC